MTTASIPRLLPIVEQDLCIVCLDNLEKPDIARQGPCIEAEDPKSHESRINGSVHANSMIAYLVPCEHHLHDACLKPWVEKANSCPVCRQRFNLVNLASHVGGPVVSTYEVEDRLQRPDTHDISPEVALHYSNESHLEQSEEEDVEEDEDEECFEGCRVCGGHDSPELLVLCDDCDRSFHTYCISPLESSEDPFYCEDCQVQIAIRLSTQGNTGLPRVRTGTRRTRASQLQENGRGTRRYTRTPSGRSDTWFSAWQSVWSHVDHAIHSTDTGSSTSGSQQLSRMRSAWQRRVQVAENQSGSPQRPTRSAPLLLQASVAPSDGLLPGPSRQRTEAELRALEPEETLESIRTWIALERARKESGITTPIPQSKGTKRRMLEVEAMDREAAEKGQANEQPIPPPSRPLKRPCRSLPHRHIGGSGRPASTTPATNSNSASVNRTNDTSASESQPSFINSLLQDVKEQSFTNPLYREPQQPLASACPTFSSTSAFSSPSPALNPTSPVISPISSAISPALSPVSPSHVHRRAQSPTPWHRSARSRSISPPTLPNITPETPPTNAKKADNRSFSPVQLPALGSSLTREIKYGIRNVVSDTLKPYYSSSPAKASTVDAINKEEFTVVNRSISHKLYDLVSHDMKTYSWDERKVVFELEVGRWNSLVNAEVQKAVRRARRKREERKVDSPA